MSEPDKVEVLKYMDAKFAEQESKLDARIGKLEVKVNCIIGFLAITATAAVANYLDLLSKI